MNDLSGQICTVNTVNRLLRLNERMFYTAGINTPTLLSVSLTLGKFSRSILFRNRDARQSCVRGVQADMSQTTQNTTRQDDAHRARHFLRYFARGPDPAYSCWFLQTVHNLPLEGCV